MSAFLILVMLWNPSSLWYPFRVVIGTIATPFEKVFSVIGFHAGGVGDFGRVCSKTEMVGRAFHDGNSWRFCL